MPSSSPHNLSLLAALGILSACRGTTEPDPGQPRTDSAVVDKECCVGKNACKGQGGCASPGKHGCAGKNACKGQGGCNMHCAK